MEELSTKKFIQYLCEEQINKQADEGFKNIKEIKNIKLPQLILELIQQVIDEKYPQLKGNNKVVQTQFICKVIAMAQILTSDMETSIYIYKNISKTVLTGSGIDCLEGNEEEVAKKIMSVQENYSLNNLCEKKFDKMAFWCIVISLREGDITKEHFIEEQQKKGVSKELINLFFALIEE